MSHADKQVDRKRKREQPEATEYSSKRRRQLEVQLKEADDAGDAPDLRTVQDFIMDTLHDADGTMKLKALRKLAKRHSSFRYGGGKEAAKLRVTKRLKRLGEKGKISISGGLVMLPQRPDVEAGPGVAACAEHAHEDGVAADNTASAASATLTVFAKSEGVGDWVVLETNPDLLVGSLKKKIKAELELRVPLDLITLHVAKDEAGKELGHKLDSTEKIAEVLSTFQLPSDKKIRIVVRKPAAAFPDLPAPLSFKPVTLGTEQWMEAAVHRKTGVTAPVFLTVAQHASVQRFIKEEPNATPQLLMPVGTIKSGKSTLVHELLPGMVAAANADPTQWPATRLRPVVFCYEFPLGENAEKAAMHLQTELAKFGRSMNVPVDEECTPSKALDALPTTVKQFAQRVKEGGGELWLLLDEVQAPILASSVEEAKSFTQRFKTLIAKISPLGRIVATGSGLLALLNAIRTAKVNGFALWDAVTYLALGREPMSGIALTMAQKLLPPYSVSWSKKAKDFITPKRLIDALDSDRYRSMTSKRPALMAYVLGCMGDAATHTPKRVLSTALKTARSKLMNESVRDTAIALGTLTNEQRRVLRDVAAGRYKCSELDDIRRGHREQFKGTDVGVDPAQLATLIHCMSEDGTGSIIVRLQAPYSELLNSWILPDGELGISFDGDKIDLAHDVRKNLVFIGEPAQRAVVNARHRLRRAVSHAVLDSLASNGIGVHQEGGLVRRPASASEFNSIPALRMLNTMLVKRYLDGKAGPEPSLSKLLRKGSASDGQGSAAATAPFEDVVGWELLLAFRHFEAHVWASPRLLLREGLNAAAVSAAARAAFEKLADPESGCFHRSPAEPARLMCKQ